VKQHEGLKEGSRFKRRRNKGGEKTTWGGVISSFVRPIEKKNKLRPYVLAISIDLGKFLKGRKEGKGA